MHKIPKDLDLSSIVGQVTPQVRVGQFDLQFTFGDVNFVVQSPVNLFQNEKQIAHWEEGKWPEPGFYEIINAKVRQCKIMSDRLLVIQLENGIEMHLQDSSDEYESMQIDLKGELWVI